MAADTVADHVRMIEVRRRPCDCGVAIVTVIATCNMRRSFSFRSEAIVTGTAASQDLGMVHRDRGLPCRLAVTVFANVGRLNMRGTFSCGIEAVMAANAITKYIAVIEDGGNPCGRVVTIVALAARGNMGGRLSGRLNAIVAGDATTGYGCVIHKSNCAPTRCDMTVRALPKCHDMISGFR